MNQSTKDRWLHDLRSGLFKKCSQAQLEPSLWYSLYIGEKTLDISIPMCVMAVCAYRTMQKHLVYATLPSLILHLELPLNFAYILVAENAKESVTFKDLADFIEVNLKCED